MIEPKSPDLTIPEWDWGDGTDSKKSSESPEKVGTLINKVCYYIRIGGKLSC